MSFVLTSTTGLVLRKMQPHPKALEIESKSEVEVIGCKRWRALRLDSYALGSGPGFFFFFFCCTVVNLQANLCVSVPLFYLPAVEKGSLGDPWGPATSMLSVLHLHLILRIADRRPFMGVRTGLPRVSCWSPVLICRASSRKRGGWADSVKKATHCLCQHLLGQQALRLPT